MIGKGFCLSHKSDPPWIVVHGHTTPYPNKSSTKGLRAYGRESTTNLLNHLPDLTISSVTNYSKNTTRRNPFAPLSTIRGSYVIAILY